MRIIFVSDFHLKYNTDKTEEQRTARIISFLKSLQGECDVLILNGDIFDLWFCWRRVIIKDYFPVLKILADLRESGCRLIFIAGNHDFWFGDFLKKYLGIEIYPDCFQEVLAGKKVFAAHGDLYTINDIRYKIFRFFIRKKIPRFIFSIIHPDLALNIGLLFSRSSRRKIIPPRLNTLRAQGLLKYAQMHRDDYDIMVMGHSHLPVSQTIGNLTYINTGDWLQHNTYAELNNSGIILKKYND
ncbi:MAG: UDP-2,3-diacylglucosamine diphosphatase [Candidatus Cloacimonetes bacterium]|nr:UDP-2,3-diacylglucosamine diphosphatase [Candidatus Cloacimonadota bacterium]